MHADQGQGNTRGTGRLQLIDLHAAVFLAPAVIGLLADAEVTAGIAGRFPLGNKNFHLTQVGDDLLRCEPLLGHFEPPSAWPILTIGPGWI